MNMENKSKGQASILESLQAVQRERESKNLGHSVAASVAAVVGIWKFVTTQSVIIVFWVLLNTLGFANYDNFPFVFLNLALSFQAAYTAPIIMMSQNRQAEADRKAALLDYHINLLAEKEIEEIMIHLEDIKTKIASQEEVGESLIGLQKKILDYHQNTKK